jgi:RNA polymerase sigma-70 factor (ECF subfamily)
MNAAEQFETLVGDYYEALFRFAMSLTRSESDAQDLTQQTFYIWATKGHQLRDPSRVKTWLFTTMHRAFLQTRRREGGFTHHVLEEVAQELPAVLPPQHDEIDSSHVLSALATVDQAYQAAVALFYLENYSQKEIAAILEVAVGTVKSRISRGIEQLRRILLSKVPSAQPAREWALSSTLFQEPLPPN